MNINKKLLKKILFGIVVFIFSVAIINYTLNSIFYYPKNTDTDINTLTILTQTLSPYTQCLYQYVESPHLFSYSNLNVSLQKIMNENGHNKNLERNYNIKFLFGEVVECQNGAGKIEPIRLTQQSFLFNDKCNNNIDDDKFYEVQIGLKKTLDLKTLLIQYQKFINTETLDERAQYGISWFAVKTSDDLETHCIGMAGPFSAYFFDSDPQYPQIKSNSSFDEQEYISLLEESLQYLVENENETMLYLNSGIFGSKVSIDFAERARYISNNGVQIIGFVAYLRGDQIKQLEKYFEVNIVDIYEKEVERIE